MNLRNFLVFAMLATLMAPSWANALVTTDNGPEPFLVEVKSSLRLSPELVPDLQALAALEIQLELTVVQRFAGPKYLELVSFPSQFTEEQALAAIDVLLEQPDVETMTPVSASN